VFLFFLKKREKYGVTLWGVFVFTAQAKVHIAVFASKKDGGPKAVAPSMVTLRAITSIFAL
jgi:hypothetical protein